MPDIRGDVNKKGAKEHSFAAATLRPPTYLDRNGKAWWKAVAAPLAQEGILNAVTYDLLGMAAVNYAKWREAEASLASQGQVITTSTGTVKVNPWLQVSKTAFESLCRVFKELGIAGPIAPVEDDLDKFLEETDGPESKDR